MEAVLRHLRDGRLDGDGCPVAVVFDSLDVLGGPALLQQVRVLRVCVRMCV